MGTSAPLKIWLVICALAIAIHLGGPPLLDPDEGRNAEVAREMAATNDYVVPRLNTLPYLDKPIMYFAAEAVFMEIFGPTEFAARLPAYLFTLATTALLVWWMGKRIGAEEAWIGGIIFLATPLTVAFARIAIFDSTLAFFVVTAIICFYESVETSERRWTVWAWAAIGLGVLTKGPVAIAVPLLVAIPYALWRRAFRALWSPAALIVFVSVITPWIWAMSLEIPEFLRYVLITETVERLATDDLGRTEVAWFFVPYLIGGAAPWSLVALSGWRLWRQRDPLTVFAGLWIVVPFIFFTLSQSKQPQYILPIMPAIAIVVARSWRAARTRAAAVITAAAGVLLLIAPFTPLAARMRPELLDATRTTAVALGLTLIAGGVVATAAFPRRGLALVALSFPVVSLPLVVNPLMNELGARRSTEAFAAAIRSRSDARTPIIGIQAFTGSLTFYLRRPLIVATPDGSELTSNYILQRYDRFIALSDSTLRPPSWLDHHLSACCEQRLYIVRTKHVHHQRRMEALGARLLAVGPRHLAYVWSGRREP